MHRFRRMVLAGTLGGLLAMSLAVPAQGAIHELVGAWCSGADQGAVLDPPGQIRFGTQSFLRALQATGLYEIQVGVVPEGQPAPFPDTVPLTIEIDDSVAAAKVTTTGGYFVFPVIEGDLAFTVYLAAVIPDHPAFAHCPGFPF